MIFDIVLYWKEASFPPYSTPHLIYAATLGYSPRDIPPDPPVLGLVRLLSGCHGHLLDRAHLQLGGASLSLLVELEPSLLVIQGLRLGGWVYKGGVDLVEKLVGL